MKKIIIIKERRMPYPVVEELNIKGIPFCKRFVLNNIHMRMYCRKPFTRIKELLGKLLYILSIGATIMLKNKLDIENII